MPAKPDWRRLWNRLKHDFKHQLKGWRLKPHNGTDGRVMANQRILLSVGKRDGSGNACQLLLHEVAHIIAGDPPPGHGVKWWLTYSYLLARYRKFEPPTRSDLIAVASNLGWYKIVRRGASNRSATAYPDIAVIDHNVCALHKNYGKKAKHT